MPLQQIVILCLLAFASAAITGCGVAERHTSTETIPAPDSRALTGDPSHSDLGWEQAVSFYADATLPSHIVTGIARAAKAWNDAAGKDILEYAGRIQQVRPSGLFGSLDDQVTVIYREDDWFNRTGKNAQTLATTVWENSPTNRQVIHRGDIILNTTTYMFQDSTLAPLEDALGREMVDTETVMIHEFGHLLGLNHISEETDPYSVMHVRSLIGQGYHQRQPSQGDVKNLRSIYAP